MRAMRQDWVRQADRCGQRLLLRNSIPRLAAPIGSQGLITQSAPLIAGRHSIIPEDRRTARWARGRFRVRKEQAAMSAAVA
jgi:hypothetical protein